MANRGADSVPDDVALEGGLDDARGVLGALPVVHVVQELLAVLRRVVEPVRAPGRQRLRAEDLRLPGAVRGPAEEDGHVGGRPELRRQRGVEGVVDPAGVVDRDAVAVGLFAARRLLRQLHLVQTVRVAEGAAAGGVGAVNGA